jgi:Binding-protein-dependent transport system inner membrane component
MAQCTLDGDDIASCCQQSGGKVVPKVMEPDPADIGLLERPTPAVANGVLMWMAAVNRPVDGVDVSIVAILLPPQVKAVPLYVMWTKVGLTGSLWSLILPNLLGDAFSIFLLRQFFLTIPKEYVDAARIDGCGEWSVLARVIVPMARPGVAAAAIFSFFYAWNDYFGPVQAFPPASPARTRSLPRDRRSGSRAAVSSAFATQARPALTA